jgi:hypothetical protein
MRYQTDRDDDRDLHGLMSREAKRAVVVNLAVAMGVRDLHDAGNQNKRHTDNPQEDNQGTPRPAS